MYLNWAYLESKTPRGICLLWHHAYTPKVLQGWRCVRVLRKEKFTFILRRQNNKMYLFGVQNAQIHGSKRATITWGGLRLSRWKDKHQRAEGIHEWEDLTDFFRDWRAEMLIHIHQGHLYERAVGVCLPFPDKHTHFSGCASDKSVPVIKRANVKAASSQSTPSQGSSPHHSWWCTIQNIAGHSLTTHSCSSHCCSTNQVPVPGRSSGH